MKIFLLGYMGSGKSMTGKLLSKTLDYDYTDTDVLIEKREKLGISELFQKKGEVYFRRKERKLLEEIIENKKQDQVISLGGGTPCYGNNMELIKANQDSVSVYLKLSIANLTARLFLEKDHRPIISHLKEKAQLEEFIRKHLFERSFFYNQSEYIINCDDKNPEEIVKEIKIKLG